MLGQFVPDGVFAPVKRPRKRSTRLVFDVLAHQGLAIGRPAVKDVEGTERGVIWPWQATTMVGRRRLDNLRQCIERVVTDEVPGDVIETGVWRGGASIFARAVLRSLGVSDRRVWLADSFAGLPPPNVERFPGDHGVYPFHEQDDLAVSIEEVKANFERIRLLDENVVFLRGWFKDTLPLLTDERWAVLRLDGDMYESTIQALDHLYPNLTPGGFVIVDDYLWVPNCKRAVDDYRANHGINEEMHAIDEAGVFWRRAAATSVTD